MMIGHCVSINVMRRKAIATMGNQNFQAEKQFAASCPYAVGHEFG
jgi:hypothetical protein